MEQWEVRLLRLFPNLQADYYARTSDPTTNYNCIAWAAGDDEDWWWPVPHEPTHFWPEPFPLSEDIDVFIRTFAQFGFKPCDDGSLEPEYEKVAIYAAGRSVKHMARQRDTGVWTSKLGSFIDIDHGTPEGIESPDYGHVERYMKRPRQLRSRD